MAAESFLVQALSTLIAEFNRRGLNYALAGGWAYSALVEPRATTDIDLLILIEQPSREGIQSLLSPLFDSTCGPSCSHGVPGDFNLAHGGHS